MVTESRKDEASGIAQEQKVRSEEETNVVSPHLRMHSKEE